MGDQRIINRKPGRVLFAERSIELPNPQVHLPLLRPQTRDVFKIEINFACPQIPIRPLMTENIDLREKVDLIPNRCFNKESQLIDSKFGVGISTFRLALKKSHATFSTQSHFAQTEGEAGLG